MLVTIDRFEEDFAVCEKDDKTMLNIKKDKLPMGVKEGDVLKINGDNIILDVAETRKRKNEIENLMKDIWK